MVVGGTREPVTRLQAIQNRLQPGSAWRIASGSQHSAGDLHPGQVSGGRCTYTDERDNVVIAPRACGSCE
jgi:hypothetical protein